MSDQVIKIPFNGSDYRGFGLVSQWKRQLTIFIPRWNSIAYLLIPRIHSLKSFRIYFDRNRMCQLFIEAGFEMDVISSIVMIWITYTVRGWSQRLHVWNTVALKWNQVLTEKTNLTLWYGEKPVHSTQNKKSYEYSSTVLSYIRSIFACCMESHL